VSRGTGLAGIVAVFLAFDCASAAAAHQAPAAAVDTARTQRARELALLTSPFDVMVAVNLSGWEASIARTLALDPTMITLEKQYPGIGKAAIDSARPLARRYCEAFVTRITDRTAQVFAERLSAAELDELIRFYRGSVGQRAVRQLFANFDSAGVGRQIAERKASTGTAEVTMDDVRKQGDLAARRAAPEFSPADQLAMIRFSQTSAAVKYAAAREVSERDVIAMANNPDPDFVAAQDKALKAAILAFAESRKRPWQARAPEVR
jgi:hypothetical protein